MDEFPADVTSLVDKLFDRLESRYGRLFVDRALSYITAAKNGLAVVELEDILSCDDEVLDSVCYCSHVAGPRKNAPPAGDAFSCHICSLGILNHIHPIWAHPLCHSCRRRQGY